MRPDGFYLGVHEPSWLRAGGGLPGPLFVSRVRLAGRVPRLRPGRPACFADGRRVYPAAVDWACDSGGFSEIAAHGRWTLTPRQYAAELRHYREAIGRLQWAAPQDWMCEPPMLHKTGRTIADHQALTIESVAELRTLLGGDVHIVPVLQGWHVDDYLRHVELYVDAGFDLGAEPLVGLGSVCRRQALGEAKAIVEALAGLGIKLHGFGMKTEGFTLYGAHLETADSMAWSTAGRLRPDPDCDKKTCANCRHYARAWRCRALAGLQDAVGRQCGLPLRYAATALTAPDVTGPRAGNRRCDTPREE